MATASASNASTPGATEAPVVVVDSSTPQKGLVRGQSNLDLGPADSASQIGESIGGDDDDDEDSRVSPTMTSPQVLACLKRKLPIRAILEGGRLGRQERNVRVYLTNSRLDQNDLKMLRAFLRLVRLAKTHYPPKYSLPGITETLGPNKNKFSCLRV